MTTPPQRRAYDVLAATVKTLKTKTSADTDTIRAVAEAAAGCAPLEVRERFNRREADLQLARWCRFTAQRVADKKRDMSEIRLDLDSQTRIEGQSPEAVKILRGTLQLANRSEIVAKLLRAADKAESTGLSEHDLQAAIARHLVGKVVA